MQSTQIRTGGGVLDDLLQAARDEKVEDGDDVALVVGHIAPKLLCLVRKHTPVLPRDRVHALQQLLAPVA